MAAYSGQNGKVLAGAVTLAEITKWTFDPKANISKWASSTTPGYKKAVAGVKDGAGGFDFKVDNTVAPYLESQGVKEGDSVTLNLYLDATRYFIVPAYIESHHYEVDMDEGPVVSGSATFTTNGAWTPPTT